jgi:hypothetical protein
MRTASRSATRNRCSTSRAPTLAQEAKPPACAIVENLPNGGLLLSTTEQTFDVDNARQRRSNRRRLGKA